MSTPDPFYFISRIADRGDATWAHYSVVEIKPELILRLQHLMDRAADLRKEFSNFQRFEFLEATPDFMKEPTDWWDYEGDESSPFFDFVFAIEDSSQHLGTAVLYSGPLPPAEKAPTSPLLLVAQDDAVWWESHEHGGTTVESYSIENFMLLEAMLVLGMEDRRIECLRALLASHPKRAAKLLAEGVEVAGRTPVPVSTEGLTPIDLAPLLESADAATRQSAIVALGRIEDQPRQKRGRTTR